MSSLKVFTWKVPLSLSTSDMVMMAEEFIVSFDAYYALKLRNERDYEKVPIYS